MRNLKRVLSLALALVMVLGMMVIGTSAATFAEEEIENVEAVEVMNALGIIKGDGDKFYPDRVLTREEAAKILAYVTLGEKVEDYLTGSESPFTDVKSDRWSAKYITYCKNLGLIHGETETTFNPKGQLTVIGFGKLLLGALGYDTAKYTGSNWINAIDADMKTAGLDVVEYDAKTLITRDAACLMALEAMKQPVGESKGWYYNDPTWKTKLGYFDTFAECFAAAKNLLDTSVNPALVLEDTSSNTMLVKNYAVTFNPDTTDAYGRPAVSYTWTVGTEEVVKLYTAEPAVVVSGEYTAKEIREGLKGYKMLAGATETDATAKTLDKIGNTDKVWYNNYSSNYVWTGLSVTEVMTAMGANNGYTGTDYADFLAANMNETTTWEVYADAKGVITDMVGIETFAATIGTVTKADATTDPVTKASTQVIVNGYNVPNVETEAFEQGDIVLVTLSCVKDAQGNNTNEYKVVTIEAAETVTGKVTAYNKAETEYTIGGEVYELTGIKGIAAPQASAVKAAVTEEKVFVLDPNGKIMAVTAVPGAEEEEAPVITNYAYVLDVNATVKHSFTAAVWPATQPSKSVEITAQVQVLLADGTVEVWDIPVAQAAKDIKNAEGTVIVNEDEYYICPVGKTPVPVVLTDVNANTTLTGENGANAYDANKLETDTLNALKGNVYTYADKALVAAVATSLPQTQGAEKKAAVITDANDTAITKTSYFLDNKYILNDKTVFVLAEYVMVENQKQFKGYIVKTGLAALEDTQIGTGNVAADMIISYLPVLDEDKNLVDAATTYVATLVFAPAAEFDKAETQAQDTTEYAFVDADYAVSFDAEGNAINTYTVTYADGTTGTIAIEDADDGNGLATGIYKLKDDGSLNTQAVQTSYKTVKVVSGTTVIFTDNDVMTTNAKSVVVGELTAEDSVVYVLETEANSKIIKLAFVVEAE